MAIAYIIYALIFFRTLYLISSDPQTDTPYKAKWFLIVLFLQWFGMAFYYYQDKTHKNFIPAFKSR